MRANKGFLFIECILSLFLISITGFFLAMLEAHRTSCSHDTMHYAHALNKARTLIDTMQKDNHLYHTTHSRDDAYTITSTSEFLYTIPDFSSRDNHKNTQLHKVTVTIAWDALNKERKKIILHAGVITYD